MFNGWLCRDATRICYGDLYSRLEWVDKVRLTGAGPMQDHD